MSLVKLSQVGVKSSVSRCIPGLLADPYGSALFFLTRAKNWFSFYNCENDCLLV